MTIDDILTLLSALATHVPVPVVGQVVPALVTVVKDLEMSGLFDGSRAVDLSTLGDVHRKALADLNAELAAHP